MSEDHGTVIIDYAHEKVHDGRTFHASYKSPEGADVADNGSVTLLIATGSRKTHFVFEVANGGDTEILVFGEISASSNGTPIQSVHMNREGLMTPAGSVFHTPTITDYGALLHNSLSPGGTGGGAGATPGGAIRPGTEWILKRNSKYAVQAINRSGSSQPMSVVFQWYEE